MSELSPSDMSTGKDATSEVCFFGAAGKMTDWMLGPQSTPGRPSEDALGFNDAPTTLSPMSAPGFQSDVVR